MFTSAWRRFKTRTEDTEKKTNLSVSRSMAMANDGALLWFIEGTDTVRLRAERRVEKE
jgi:hypothetical protein